VDNSRNSLKKINNFANREYKEKRPKSVKVLRLKSKILLTRGILPNYQVRQEGPVVFLVISDYGKTFMVYSFNRNGDRIGGQHYDVSPKLLKEIEKKTI